MKKSIQLVLILCFCFPLSCKNPTEAFRKDEVFKIDIDNCNSYIDLKLSDLIDSCNLVQLETTKECLLDQYIRTVFIGDKFIVINDRNGVYKFSKSGKFISKILSVGRGPQELSYAITSSYDEKKDILYYDDIGRQGNSHIYVFDVGSEKFLKPILKCFSEPWWSFFIYNDSIIISSIMPGAEGSINDIKKADSIPYAFFSQNLNGKLLNGIPSNKKYLFFNSTLLQRASLIPVGNDLQVRYQYDDTLFKFFDGKMYPYVIPVYNTQKFDLPSDPPQDGERRTYFERYGNTSFLIITSTYSKGMNANGEGNMKADYKTVHIFLNKLNGQYNLIKSYTDDLIGKIQTDENEIRFPSPLPNNRFYVLYYPHEILDRPLDGFKGKLISESAFRQLSKIKTNLNETDNPILLIGTVKERISVQ